ncbi:hypothetical protein [Moraxella lacunata]|uniref:hypothetical protein n=1 Tax=Moraxella lacunata TaxID=477 RepID=UPI0011C03E26|nr:hypothetical protein [Moraxella lacunata]
MSDKNSIVARSGGLSRVFVLLHVRVFISSLSLSLCLISSIFLIIKILLPIINATDRLIALTCFNLINDKFKIIQFLG